MELVIQYLRKVQFQKKNKDVIGKSKFQIKVADYNIQIPKLVREKIAKIVDVDTQLTLKKK